MSVFSKFPFDKLYVYIMQNYGKSLVSLIKIAGNSAECVFPKCHFDKLNVYVMPTLESGISVPQGGGGGAPYRRVLYICWKF